MKFNKIILVSANLLFMVSSLIVGVHPVKAKVNNFDSIPLKNANKPGGIIKVSAKEVSSNKYAVICFGVEGFLTSCKDDKYFRVPVNSNITFKENIKNSLNGRQSSLVFISSLGTKPISRQEANRLSNAGSAVYLLKNQFVYQFGSNGFTRMINYVGRNSWMGGPGESGKWVLNFTAKKEFQGKLN